MCRRIFLLAESRFESSMKTGGGERRKKTCKITKDQANQISAGKVYKGSSCYRMFMIFISRSCLHCAANITGRALELYQESSPSQPAMVSSATASGIATHVSPLFFHQMLGGKRVSLAIALHACACVVIQTRDIRIFDV
jgi:hypothetical protein